MAFDERLRIQRANAGMAINAFNGTFLEWRYKGKNGEEVHERILNVICFGVPKSKECPAVAGTPGKAC
jgi:hypothetical protein